MTATYWLTPPNSPGVAPLLACLDEAQVAYYTEAGYKLTQDEHTLELDGKGCGFREG